MNEEDKIELRSEEFQEVLGGVPPWILRWGITGLAFVVVLLLAGSAVFKYPDTISAQVTLTGSTPPAAVVARSSGKLKELFVSDNRNVNAGEYLAVIDNPANTEDVQLLKAYLDSLNMDNDSFYWIENQNVQAGETVFTTIPTGSFQLIGKAALPVARSGKVKIGQKVNIRLENFPENEFGILRGKVQNISLVPSQSGETIYYTVEIRLPEGLLTTYQKKLPYLPNMQGRADVITEDMSLLSRLFMPVRKIWSINS